MPTLICLHHPPVTVGIPALDAIRLTDAVELEAAPVATMKCRWPLLRSLHRFRLSMSFLVLRAPPGPGAIYLYLQ